MTRASALAPYPDPEAREDELDRIATRVGARVETYGSSVQGRPLRAAVVPADRPSVPRILCSANIHGPEYVGGRVALGLLQALGDGGPARALRGRAEVWVIPCLNPDGYARTWSVQGDARVASMRTNAHGVDLNRNFPRPAGGFLRLPGAGSDSPGDATYRGPAPLSEPETRHLSELLENQRFHASANMHSFMGTVIPARVTDAKSFATYAALCRALADGQREHRYRRLSTRILDTYTGEQEDHQHHALRTWAVCVETFPWWASLKQHWRAPTPFWRFNPRDPGPWVDNDVPGLIAFFEAALALERPEGPAA